MSDLTFDDVTAYQFTLTYDPAVLTVDSARVAGTLSAGANPTVNTTEGEVRVAYATSEPLRGSGTLLQLDGRLSAPGQSLLTLTEIRFFDEAGQEVNVTASSGRLDVVPDTQAPAAPTSLSVATEGTDATLSWDAFRKPRRDPPAHLPRRDGRL